MSRDPVEEFQSTSTDEMPGDIHIRTQAAALEAPIPIVDGSKPYYVETDGVRRKYLPGAVEALEAPEPVAWFAPEFGDLVMIRAPSPSDPAKWIPLVPDQSAHIAALEAALATAQTLAEERRLRIERLCSMLTEKDGALAAAQAELSRAQGIGGRLEVERDAALADAEKWRAVSTSSMDIGDGTELQDAIAVWIVEAIRARTASGGMPGSAATEGT